MSRRITRAEIAVAYKETFSTDAGKIVLADLVRQFGYVNESLFNCQNTDPRIKADQVAAMKDGHRQVLIHINFNLNADPAVLREATEEDTGEFN